MFLTRDTGSNCVQGCVHPNVTYPGFTLNHSSLFLAGVDLLDME